MGASWPVYTRVTDKQTLRHASVRYSFDVSGVLSPLCEMPAFEAVPATLCLLPCTCVAGAQITGSEGHVMGHTRSARWRRHIGETAT